jgi:hypothetical protein
MAQEAVKLLRREYAAPGGKISTDRRWKEAPVLHEYLDLWDSGELKTEKDRHCSALQADPLFTHFR